MNKEYKIKLDLNKKLYNKKMAFNQFDENVNDFYIEVTKNNEVVKDLDKSIITLVAIKPNGEVDAQFIEVKEGQIYADLKPSMCDLVGNYQAKAMIVLEGEIVTTDTINYSVNEDKIISRLNDDVVSDERFPLFTDALARLSDIEISEEQRVINEAERILSEENRKIEEAKRVEAELIRQHEEADRAKYDATRESNENIRKQNESIRLANETNRIDEEAKRVKEETKRVEAEQLRNANYNFMTEDEERRRSEANAHKEAETLRVQAETNRVNEEAKRRTTEQARVSAENTRVNNENTREANEVVRKNNETKRVEAETQRQNRYNSFIADAEANANNFENYTNTAKVNEEERKSNELDRKSQEDRRVSNEVERISNENTRKANEKAREKNETSRQNIFENKVSEVDEKIVEINATKDNFVSSVNTKVNTKISEIEVAKSDMTNTVSNKINEVETRFNALTSSQQQDAEVIDARDGETSLKARLDRDIEKAKQVYVNVEGSHISTDSNVGYLKDVKILGNTIQSASNLADIRSVGDKIEGQELYEIPVLSVGKNLFDGNKFTPREAINQYSYIDGILTMSCDGQAYRRVDYILPNTLVHGKRYILTANVKALEYSSGYTPSQNFGYGYYNGGSSDYYGSFDASSNTAKLEFVYNEQGENVIGFHNEVKEGLTKLQWSNIQIEEGTVATQYEPYVEDKLTILSPVQLEKVGNVRDRIIEKDGIWGVEKNVTTSVDENNVLVNTKTDSEFIPLPHDQQVKLRTFANKTNISFLTEIEGTIKAQVPKSLGATVNTHTEQINNLNKELDRVKKLEESTVSTVTTESDFTSVEATSNGYFEDVKLEGKTLVNLIEIDSYISNDTLLRFYVKNKLSMGKTISIFNPTNKPVRFEIASNNVWARQIILSANSSKVESLSSTEYIVNISAPKSEGWLDGDKDEFKKCCIVLEGDHTQNPPSYFEGLKSVGEDTDEIVVSSVKGDGNLFDATLDTQTKNGVTFSYDGATGEIVLNGTCTENNTCVMFKYPTKFIEGNTYYLRIFGTTINSPLAHIRVYDDKYVGNNLATTSRGTSIHKSSSTRKMVNTSIRVDSGITFNNFRFKVQLIVNEDRAEYIPQQSDKKRLLYYNTETQMWEKPILREWDSIEKHTDGKYYYHVRSIEEDYVEGDEIVTDYITDMTTTVKPLSQEKIYECTNMDLITYNGETNYIVESGVLSPRTTLKVHNNISNVVSLLQKKVSLLESNVKASQEVQDMMILETDMRMLDIELALMEFIPMTLNLGGSNMLRSATYFNFLKNHIINETYEKEYLENVMNKYLATGRINQDEYNELYKMLYPPVYDIELPIEY